AFLAFAALSAFLTLATLLTVTALLALATLTAFCAVTAVAGLAAATRITTALATAGSALRGAFFLCFLFIIREEAAEHSDDGAQQAFLLRLIGRRGTCQRYWRGRLGQGRGLNGCLLRSRGWLVVPAVGLVRIGVNLDFVAGRVGAFLLVHAMD